MLNEQSSVNISCFEDENWDEYGVNDALQHNLLADGTDTLHSVATSSESQSKLPSQPSWDTDDTSIERSSSSIIPSQVSTSPRPIPVLPEINTWIAAVDNNCYSLPFDISEQSYEPSTSSPTRKRSLQSPQPRPATNIKRTKRTANPSASQVSITLPPNHSGSEDIKNPSLFPCPFYHHNPTKYSTQQWRSCMGPGWNISRLKEHIYRRHCLSEHGHVCQRCQADFGSQSELAYHQQRAVCSELSEPLSGKIGKLKKGLVHERRTNMPDAKKWTTIYRILFDCDPVVDSPSDTQSNQPSQPTESPETMTSFEVFLRTKKRLDGDETTSEQVQTCLDLLQEWRAQQNAPRPIQASRDPSTISNGDFALVDFSQLPQSEVEPLPGVGNEDVILNLSFLDELYNTFHVSDQYFLDTFSYGPSGDVLWDFS